MRTVEEQKKAHLIKKSDATVHLMFGHSKGDKTEYTFMGVWRKTSDDINLLGEKVVYKLLSENFEVPNNCVTITNED